MSEYKESPCVRNCCLTDEDICLGCFRSLEEISRWSQSTNKERCAILVEAEKRKKEREEKLKYSKGLL